MSNVSARAAELKLRLRRELQVGVAVIAIFFGGFGGWAAVAPLESAVVAPGAVVVAGARQAVQHKDGGIVRRILVQDGDRVQAGDVLLEIDDTELRAQADVASNRFVTLAALRARLVAERDGLDDFETPPELAELTGAERTAADAAVLAERQRLTARLSSLANETGVIEQRVAQLQAQIQGLEAQTDSQVKQSDLIAQELEGTRALNKRGLTPTTRVRALERDQAETEGRRAEYGASIASAREQISEQQLQIIQLRRKHEEEVRDELQKTEQQLAEVAPQREAILAQLGRTLLRAPASGQVVSLKAHTETGVVAPGEVLMEIVPEDKPLVVQAHVEPRDVDGLSVGVQAQIRLTAFSSSEAPILYGELTRVSADRMVEEKTGAPYYLAEAVIPPEELSRIAAIRSGATALRAGMPAEVIFPKGRRTALQYLVEPLGARLHRALAEG